MTVKSKERALRQFTDQTHSGRLYASWILAWQAALLAGSTTAVSTHHRCNQTLRFTKQRDLTLTQMHTNTPGANLWLFGAMEAGNYPMESKGSSSRITRPIRKTWLSSCWHLSFHPRSICFSFRFSHCEWPHCQRESKVCFPYSADAECYRPHLESICKWERGGRLSRRRGGTGSESPGRCGEKATCKMSPGEIGGAGVYWCWCCSLGLLDVRASNLNKSISREHELMYDPHLPQMRKTPPWPPPDLVDRQTGGEQAPLFVLGWTLWRFTIARVT